MAASFAAACGGGRAPAPAAAPKEAGKGFVSLSRVPVRAEPKASAPVVALLPRGSEVKLLEADGAFTHVETKGTPAGWVEAGTFETAAEKEARERRTEAVSTFPSIPGRIVAPCPVYLAPDFGSARWGELEDGDPVDVVLAEHDFLGVKLLGIPLAFVPAHAVRFLAPTAPTPAVPEPAAAAAAPTPARSGEAVPPPAGGIRPAPEPEPASPEPYAALPFGAEPPVLKTRVEPQYPASARKAGISGEVVLQVVVERDGTIGSVFATQEAPMGLTEAATDAVRRWVYTPARLDGHPIAVVKTVRVRFALPAP